MERGESNTTGYHKLEKNTKNKAVFPSWDGRASCNASNRRASFSGYSGSVLGYVDLLGCFYTQQWAGAEDGEGIRLAAGTGNE